MSVVSRKEARLRRQRRVRTKIRGTGDRPRLCVFRSARHIYAQLIDDTTGRTLTAVSTVSKGLLPKIGKDAGNAKGAYMVGAALAQEALQKGIKKAVFDRNGFLYHGRVRALSQGARDQGLDF